MRLHASGSAGFATCGDDPVRHGGFAVGSEHLIIQLEGTTMTDDSRPGEPTPPPAPQYQAAPQYEAAPQYSAAPPAGQGAAVPGKTLGIVSLVLSIVGFLFFWIVAPIAGIITGIIARKQSKAVGAKNTPATAGIIISIVALVLQIILTIIFVALAVAGISSAVEQCSDLGPGTHVIDGVTYTCG
jgi:hypothetical protein